MKDFFNRHIIPTVCIVFGLSALLFMGHLFADNQVGINPAEFILKAFGKVFYVGVAWIVTHIVIKYFFPTVYSFCHYTQGLTQGTSDFRIAWENYPVNRYWDQRLTLSIATHVGVFGSVCLLLALAF